LRTGQRDAQNVVRCLHIAQRTTGFRARPFLEIGLARKYRLTFRYRSLLPF
jgi:hypothetical protein